MNGSALNGGFYKTGYYDCMNRNNESTDGGIDLD